MIAIFVALLLFYVMSEFAIKEMFIRMRGKE